MKRAKPDPVEFSRWVKANLKFDPAQDWPARGLWCHWTDHAEAAGVEKGTPRSFSNALAKLGSPWTRGWGDRTKARLHQGVTLVVPIFSPIKPDDWAFGNDAWLTEWCDAVGRQAGRYLHGGGA